MMKSLKLFATTPKGLEQLLVNELKTLGAETISEKLAGVAFTGDVETAYKICLWSRFTNRVLLLLKESPAKTPEELYQVVKTIHWDEHLTLEKTFAVHCVISQSVINHTLFAAQKIKDAIVDQFREKYNERPNVSRVKPDVSIYVYLHRDVAYISIDLSGESLHKRGYRLSGGHAPLKENLAAAILQRAGWKEIAKAQGVLLDPMCGSGTLLIEAAMMAADIAPGLLRDYMGFLGWKQHVPTIWEKLLRDAKSRKTIGLKQLPKLVGYDIDSNAIKLAFENISRAELSGFIHVEKRDLAVFAPSVGFKPGLIVTNAPYGERLSDEYTLQPLYTLLGNRLKENFLNWHAAIFTGNPELGKKMGLRAKHKYAFFNGPIPCQLLLFDIEQTYFVDNSPQAENERRIREAKRLVANLEKPIALINRLQKNLRHNRKQAERQGLTKFRIYDGDLPEFKFTIDIKDNEVYVVEYSSPKSVDPKKIQLHRAQLLAILPEILNVTPAQIFYEQSYARFTR